MAVRCTVLATCVCVCSVQWRSVLSDGRAAPPAWNGSPARVRAHGESGTRAAALSGEGGEAATRSCALLRLGIVPTTRARGGRTLRGRAPCTPPPAHAPHRSGAWPGELRTASCCTARQPRVGRAAAQAYPRGAPAFPLVRSVEGTAVYLGTAHHVNSGLRPYPQEYTRSRQIPEVKPVRAIPVLRWATSWEPVVL